VLLIALWARSYWWADNVLGFLGHDLASLSGDVVIDDTIRFTSIDDKIVYLGGGPSDRFWFIPISLASIAHARQGSGIAVRYWALVLPLTVLASAPWLRHLRWRFSLRTLLIATTLAAVALGLVSYMASNK
jgi:hypothetical protein